MSDDLRQPLRRRSRLERVLARRPSLLKTASAVAGVSGLVLAVWLVRLGPLPDSNLIARMKLQPVDPAITASVTKPAPVPAKKQRDVTLPPVEPSPADVAADRAMAKKQRHAALVRAPRRALVPAPARGMTETGKFGKLPRIGRGGRKPAQVYARPVPLSVARSGKPKIALLIGGMGINHALTNEAITQLPGPVSFAFAPYGKGLQAMVNRARAQGHEVLLHLPMEPAGYPQVNPGPRTLLTSAAPEANFQNLMWHMSRFTGYTGVTNYMGSRFNADGGSLMLVMAQLKRRGLVFLDSGTSRQALTGQIGRAVNLPVRRTDMTIDTTVTYKAVTAALRRLEEKARTDGLAIGTGTGLRTTIDAVRQWQQGLDQRGIILIPVSAAYHRQAG